jgi:hypothetical protein
LVAAACLISGTLFDLAYTRSTPGGIQTQATIVDFVRRNSRQVYPVFEFHDLDGNTHRVVNSTQQALFRFGTGDSVAIAYSPSNPILARIDTFWFDHRWLIAAVFVVLTALGGALSRATATSER